MCADDIHLTINLQTLCFVGCWPDFITKKYPKLKVPYRIYAILFRSYFFLFTLSQYVEIYDQFDEPFVLLNNLSVSLLYSVSFLKLQVCASDKCRDLITKIRNREYLLFYDRTKENQEINDEYKEIKVIYMKHVKWNWWINKFTIGLGVVTILPFFTNPILNQLLEPIKENLHDYDNSTTTIIYGPRPLPFTSWFPFDKYKYYYTAYLLHIIFGTIGASVTVTTDILFWGFMIYTIGQLKGLQYLLKHHREVAKELRNNNGRRRSGVKMELEVAVKDVLGRFVREHQEVISFINELNITLNFLMLLDFLIASMQMGILAFQVIVSGFSLQQFTTLEYLFAMLIQLTFFYWHANEISYESGAMFHALWDSDWLKLNSMKSTLIIIMMRIQKPLALNVGPSTAMTMQAALNILRAAYSYVTLIRQMYIRKTNL